MHNTQLAVPRRDMVGYASRQRGALMRRREFITLLGGAAAGWPLAVRAQQPGQIKRLGVLIGLSEDDPAAQARLAAFRQALAELGWIGARNVHFEVYWTAGEMDLLRTHA